MAAGLFCEHKRLRTGCPLCKASAVPPAAPEVTRYVSSDERLDREEKRAVRATAPRTPGAPARAEEKSEAPKLRGPGKPIMPTRQKKKGITADEAAAAKPWWVKK